MRVVGLMLGLALLLLLTANCVNEKSAQNAASAQKQAADTAARASGTSVLEQAFKVLGSMGDDSGWEFWVSDGENVLAFSHGWPDEVGVWELRLFKGTEAPHYLEVDIGPSTWFRAAPLEDILPLEPDALITELAGPARTAISVAKSSLDDEDSLQEELEEEEMRVLQAVAEGRIEAAYYLQMTFTVAARELYCGGDTYAAFKSGNSLSHYGTANLLLIPAGFIVSWGPELGGEVAFYYDGKFLSAIPHAELDNPVPLEEAQRVCARNIAKLAAIADAAKLLDDRQVAEFRTVADVLSTHVPEVHGTRLWMYLNELYEQLVMGEGLSPPRHWTGHDPGPVSCDIKMQIYDVKLDFIDYEDWDWGCMLEGKDWRIIFEPRPSGLIAGYIDDRWEGPVVLPVVVTDVVMDRATTPDVEDAVSALSTMAQTVLASSEAKEKMNGECLDALAKVAERRLSVVSPSHVGTSLMELVIGGRDEMMYLLVIPRVQDGDMYFRATSRVATLDFIPKLSLFRRHQDIGYQVRLERGRLFLISSEESTSSRIGAEVKDAISSISRMRDSGLLHVPDFACGIVDELVQSVSTAQEYDSVTVKPLGEIAELTVGRG